LIIDIDDIYCCDRFICVVEINLRFINYDYLGSSKIFPVSQRRQTSIDLKVTKSGYII